jgi:hypothetical protein
LHSAKAKSQPLAVRVLTKVSIASLIVYFQNRPNASADDSNTKIPWHRSLHQQQVYDAVMEGRRMADELPTFEKAQAASGPHIETCTWPDELRRGRPHHQAVNSSVPKSLTDTAGRRTLQTFLETPITPELVPVESEPGAGAEAVALQDFFLCYMPVRPLPEQDGRLGDLAKHAWGDAARGDWPPIIPKAERIV